jgi:putative chitinase
MITKEIIKKISPKSSDKIVDDLVIYFNKHFETYDINSKLRKCHFLAQAAHETDGFKTLEEYASGAAYEGRKDLGNTVQGDGRKFKGRGIFQLTGRANYKTFGTKLGYDLVKNPELAETPEVSVLVALEYWKDRGLNKHADNDDVETITRRINGGLNGFDDRKLYLARAKQTINDQITDSVTARPEPTINIVMAKKGDKSSYVMDLQKMLNNKGATIIVDGHFGSATEVAVREFQKRNDVAISGLIDTDTLNKLLEL